jgi:hypothetical protein
MSTGLSDTCLRHSLVSRSLSNTLNMRSSFQFEAEQ